MAKKKACKEDKIFVDGELCPVCKKASFTTNWQGRVQLLDPKRSKIAHAMGINMKGEYAIKVR